MIEDLQEKLEAALQTMKQSVVHTSEGVLDAVHQLVYLDPRNSDTGITIDPSNKDPKLDTGFSQSLKHDCTSPEDNGIPHNDIETETVLEMALAGLELKQTTLRIMN